MFGRTMAPWLSNPWLVGIVTSVVGGLLVIYFLKIRQRSRESGPEVSRARILGKSKVYWIAALIGLGAAWPAYYLGIWLWDRAFGGADLEQLEAGAVLRDCEVCPDHHGGAIGILQYGIAPSERWVRYDNEGPIHPVTIPETFGVAVYEVTPGQFREFVDDSGHDAGDACWTFEGSRWRERRDALGSIQDTPKLTSTPLFA